MTFSANLNPTFPKQPQTSRVQIANADASNSKTILTAGSNGTKISAIIAASTDSSTRILTLAITNSTAFPLATFTIAIGAGTVSGTPALNLLDPTVIAGLPIDSDGNPFLYLISGDTLTISSSTTVTSGKLVTIHAFGSDF